LSISHFIDRYQDNFVIAVNKLTIEMAYDLQRLEKAALKAIKDHKLVFVNDVLNYLPCGKSTFYNLKLDGLDSIKDALHVNRVSKKKVLRDKWEASENPTLNIALYKLLADRDELSKLSNQPDIEDKPTHVVQILNGQELPDD
jgi:hypothetical protein